MSLSFGVILRKLDYPRHGFYSREEGRDTQLPVFQERLWTDEERKPSASGKEIPLFKVHMPEGVLEALRATLFSGYVGQGQRVKEFERALQPWFGNPRVLTVNSCTSALQLALRLAGVGPGDEVISTPVTCAATNLPILALGGKVVWADVDPATGNIAPRDVERRITPKTRAILAVHWGGTPCDLEELNAIGRRRRLKVIEDAAHAFGATYRGLPIGSHSDFVCFSFQAIKHLTTVDGGALTCRDPESYRRGKLLRWYGLDREREGASPMCDVDIEEYGYKFHMNDVNATIGLEQLKHVAGVLRRHRENASYYRSRFSGLPGLTLLECRPDRESSSWLFTLRVRERPRFVEGMRDAGVVVSQVHARNDAYAIFRGSRSALPGVDLFCAEQVSIPVGWWVTEGDREHIADTVIRLCRSSLKRPS